MDTFLFDLASELTGGLITDIKTAMAAMLLFGFIIIGLDMLKDVLSGHFHEKLSSRCHDKYYKLSEENFEKYNSMSPKTFGHQYHKSLYKKYLNDSINSIHDDC